MRCALSMAVLTVAALAPARAGRAADPITFEKHIRPILKAHCFHCHGAGEKLKGGLDLRLRRLMEKGGESGPAIVPGQRDESLLYDRVQSGEMPPADKKPTPHEIELIGNWIAAGAATARPEPERLDPGVEITPEEREFWAFQPLAAPAVPKVAAPELVRTPIDAFLLARLAAQGYRFAPEADRRALVQRAYFDLLGLPPSAEEVESYLADDRADAYERLVDRLLSSPRYGERWGRHWLDVAGYADSDGYVDADTVRPYAYKYRDYVIRAHNDDLPYDRFIVEQLAGDELLSGSPGKLSPDDVEKLVATGFLRMGADGTAADGLDQPLARNAVVGDTIKILTTSLLALSVGCAQCHDHRYDPIPQADYYRLRAVLAPAYNLEQWRSPPQRLISLYTDADRAAAAQVEAEAQRVDQARNQKQAEHLRAALEKELEKFPAASRPALRAAWEAPADKRTPEQQKLLAENPSVNLHAGVLYQYNQAAADELKKLAAQVDQIRARKPVEDFVQAIGEVPGQVPQTRRFHRGDYRQPQEVVAPGGLTILSPPGQRLQIADRDPNRATSGRRLALARWIVGAQNPLTARVLVNRVWLHHFGRGLVNTPADFGSLGERPTHPELLDWLARDFVAGGWRLKRLHRLIMTSTAYRQSSRREGPAAESDGDNRLYARMSVRRLDAEALRDRILATSGVLGGRMFGPPLPVKEDEVGQVVVGVGAAPASAGWPVGHEAFCRSVYVQVRRSQPLALLQVFDAPVMETNCDRRVSSTVATQALLLMNSELALAQSQYFALRLEREAGAEPAAQVERAWRLAFQRPPRAEEAARAVAFLKQRQAHLAAQSLPPPDGARQALASLCQVLLSTNEFLYVE